MDVHTWRSNEEREQSAFFHEPSVSINAPKLFKLIFSCYEIQKHAQKHIPLQCTGKHNGVENRPYEDDACVVLKPGTLKLKLISLEETSTRKRVSQESLKRKTLPKLVALFGLMKN
uniref:Uncharacterized protein n=1 Tax=Glossina austeni TaxID=7395 RepID=A0A1A9VFJ5_GLOAU